VEVKTREQALAPDRRTGKRALPASERNARMVILRENHFVREDGIGDGRDGSDSFVF
jgi:hypothetical protein